MAHIRTKTELDARNLTPAESQLIAACQTGEYCVLGDGEPPAPLNDGKAPDPTRHINADVLRYLILGGCDDCTVDDIGVWMSGAHVTGTLDLDFTTARGAVRMQNCRFDQRIDMEQTQCKVLSLSGSVLQGLRAQGLEDRGDVFLRNITTHATIDLAGATIGGTLDCDDATFDVNEGRALNGQGAKITGGVFWRRVTVSQGSIGFHSSQITTLADDPDCWPSGGRIDLDGMTYDRIAGAPTDAKTRLAWLEKGSNWNGTFYPQPYTQLAKVLRDMGHDTDARKILAERERLLVLADIKQRAEAGGWLARPLNLWFRFWGLILRLSVGYGHRPFRSILVLLTLIIIAIIPSHYAWEEGSFAPNSAVIQNSDDWKAQLTTANPAVAWSAKDSPGQDWETFNRYAYGVDIVIPIINFGQTEAWAPSTTRGPWGWHLWWLRWVLSSLGWIVTALGAAAITGLIRRD